MSGYQLLLVANFAQRGCFESQTPHLEETSVSRRDLNSTLTSKQQSPDISSPQQDKKKFMPYRITKDDLRLEDPFEGFRMDNKGWAYQDRKLKNKS